jgi:hypothetical protein
VKTMILAAVAVMSLGVAAACAAGGPSVRWEPQTHGAQAFSDHQNEPVVQFLGKGTVVGGRSITIPTPVGCQQRPVQPGAVNPD